MGKLSAEERPVIGQLANEVRSELENEIESRKSALAARLQEAKLRAETLDVAAFVRLAREAANLPHHADAV